MTETVTRPGIRFATDRQGSPVEWLLDGPEPHMILTGATGRGASTTARVVAAAAARLGMDVRFCAVKVLGAEELMGVQGITVAAGLPETAGLIGRTWTDMRQRRAGAEAAAGSDGDLQRIVLIVDDFTLLDLGLSEICGEERPSPVTRQLGQLLMMSHAAAINVLLTGHAVLAAVTLGDRAVQKCGTRAALGQVGGESARLLFGDEDACSDCDGRIPGTGVVLTPAGTPRPAVMLDPAAAPAPPDGWVPQYKAAEPGRWFVVNIRWPSGTCGTVRRGDDRMWRIEQDPGAGPYPSRGAAAWAEQRLAVAAGGKILPDRAELTPAASPPGQRARRRGRRPA